MTIAQEVMKFISQYSEVTRVGQGNITITCKALWNMTDEQFKARFQVTNQ